MTLTQSVLFLAYILGLAAVVFKQDAAYRIITLGILFTIAMKVTS